MYIVGKTLNQNNVEQKTKNNTKTIDQIIILYQRSVSGTETADLKLMNPG